MDGFSIVAAVSAGVAAAYAIRESMQTQHQMDNSLRPWVGLSKPVDLTSHGIVTGYLKNYGTLPAQKVKYWTGVQLNPFTKEQMDKMGKPDTDEVVMLPDSEKEVKWTIPQYDKVVRERLSVGMVLIVQYTYAKDKQGRYQMTLQYNPSTRQDDSFTESIT